MRLDPTVSIPPWLRALLQRSIKQRRLWLEQRVISVTTLLQPAWMVYLQDRHWDEIVVDPMSLLPAALGNAWHEEAAKCDPGGGMSEARIEVPIGDWTLTGQPDYWDPDVIVDRKTAKVWSRVFGKPEWEQQLNLYRWLIHTATGNLIPRLEVHVLYTDWTDRGAMRNADHPRKRFEVIEAPVWGIDTADRFIEKRLSALEKAIVDPCTPEERWERGEWWAVMKPQRKTAVKRCGDEDEAYQIAKSITGGYVEHRPGEKIRCKSWCNVSQFCPVGREA